MSIKEDHNRFRDIIKGKIKEDFRKYVSQGEMIGKRERKTLSKSRFLKLISPTFAMAPNNRVVLVKAKANLETALENPETEKAKLEVIPENIF